MTKYLRLLKEKFPQKEDVLTELINLEAILHLPKGTEHFVSDLHGEFEAFDYILRNGSGSIKEKVVAALEHAEEQEIDALCSLIFYPEEILQAQQTCKTSSELADWYRQIIPPLLTIVNHTGRKYTRSKLRKNLPKQFTYIIEELLTEVSPKSDKKGYFETIIENIITLEQADRLISAFAYLIQRLTVDHLHVVGDIYDRGPHPDLIMERLIALPSVDIQWGNHDVIWLGAMSGSALCIVNLLRICARYGNLALVEESYGINLRALVDYSKKYYTPSPIFQPKLDGKTLSKEEMCVSNQVQQAAAILQFKLEEQLIDRRPDFMMAHRKMLSAIDYQQQTIQLGDCSYELMHFQAPTVDPKQPQALTQEEEWLLKQLHNAFQNSEKLRRHMDFLIAKGAMYLCYNGNLLFHGCIPLHENGDLKSLRIDGKNYSGKALLDFFESQIKKSYREPQQTDDLATDFLWYLWTGDCSSLFGKQPMTTFERYYIAQTHTHREKRNPYYQLRNEPTICREILQLFHLPSEGRIINGHTPVEEKKGENPIKADGKLIVIDGGYAKGYQKKTGIAGYTLLYNSFGMQLAAHQPFLSIADALQHGSTNVSVKRLVATAKQRTTVKETTIGQAILEEIHDLKQLYAEYDHL